MRSGVWQRKKDLSRAIATLLTLFAGAVLHLVFSGAKQGLLSLCSRAGGWRYIFMQTLNFMYIGPKRWVRLDAVLPSEKK
ncbi:hypothetical protein DSM101010T_07110 [Desulfovibrio subterraneus]|uniref:Uncharacterized protein n=1 Tax=Desulfovibrio subterraneus TaxID=2718620 RepID=A0A7J0BFB4_9BACT|nr:hypothetical protein DSM101010T_07110 [Desulfovibrio subterraneus]